MNATAEPIAVRPAPKQLQSKHEHMALEQPTTRQSTALSYGLFWWACLDDRSIIKVCTRAASKINNAFLSLMTVLYGLTQTPSTHVPITELVVPDRSHSKYHTKSNL